MDFKKTLIWIFIGVFILIYAIFNGDAFLAWAKYKYHQFIITFTNEMHRPINWNSLSYNNTGISSSTNVNISQNTISNSRQNIIKEQNVPLPALPLEAQTQNILQLPKFNIEAPIWATSSSNLQDIYKLLRQGVVLFPGSTIPGGEYAIILGHSSSYPWTPGRYKSVFSLLNEFSKGDLIYVFWDQKPMVFQVVEKQIFLPWPKGEYSTETIFPPEPNKKILILQSCWPVGVNFKRVAIKTELIAPNAN